jgi:hypothetical protein
MNTEFSQKKQLPLGDTVPIDYLRECLVYCRDTGVLRWRVRPDHHFASERAALAFSMFVGRRAFTAIGWDGYRVGSLTFQGCNVQLRAHRVAWALHYGRWPDCEIDHINRVRSDNRLKNLREASRTENARNRETAAGLPCGVYIAGNKYVARIRVDGKRQHLGRFATPAEAGAAYAKAADALAEKAGT